MKLVMSFLLLAIALLVGCAAATVYEAGQAAAALLVVQNDRTDDSWIYLQHNGAKARKLGLAHALRADTLVLPASAISPGTSIGFVAISFATGAVDQSDLITAERGVVYRWALGPSRGHNFISARSAE